MAMIQFIWSLCLVISASALKHPGLLVNNQDIERAKVAITAQSEPWLSSWKQLISLPYSDAAYVGSPVAIVSRSSNQDFLWHDVAAAFDLAIRWKISGEDQYADAASAVLVGWADTLQEIESGTDDDYLMAGLQGYEIANAAELLRDYEPFKESGLASVQNMMTSIFLPMNLDFLNHVLGSEHIVTHFFANWELCNIASAMAIAILTDNQTVWDFTVNYFKNGEGNGAISNAITNIVDEPGTGYPLGQGQESGRDQGHSSLDIQLLAVIAQQAWNQGEDLYGYDNNRILFGAEYFARYNLGYDVPFEPFANALYSFDVISESGRGSIRPTWELLYAHYAQIKGLEAKWTKQFLNHVYNSSGGYELGIGAGGETSGAYDGLGWGSLLYHRADNDDDKSNSNTTSTSSLFTTSTTPSSSISTSNQSSPTRIKATTITSSATADVSSASEPTSISSHHHGHRKHRHWSGCQAHKH